MSTVLLFPARADLNVDTDDLDPRKTNVQAKAKIRRETAPRPRPGKGYRNESLSRSGHERQGRGDSSAPSRDRVAQEVKGAKRLQKYEARVKRVKDEISRITAANNANINAYDNCISSGGAGPCPRPAQLTPPDLPSQRVRGARSVTSGVMVPQTEAPAAAPAPQIVPDPVTVAHMAVANLTLTAPTPGIGPSPDLNKWKMAAVGYPLWLWAEGNTDPAPVSDSIYTLAVSLDARVTKIDFLMGDGNSVTCQSLGTKWTPGTPAGQESPTCGYRYSKPSLPEGKYTVTARTHWAIDWSINGQNGTIPYVQSATTQLPVGELQVLVR